MAWHCADCGKRNADSVAECLNCGANRPEDIAVSRIGKILVSRYRIDKVLKAGGMGCVFLGYDLQKDRVIALKEMKPGSSSREDEDYARSKFMQEVDLLAKLEHTGLPRVTDFFVTRNQDGILVHYLVMTYIEGQDLETLMGERDGKPLPFALVMDYSLQILKILNYLHTNDPTVVYRDLKPSNVIIRDGRVYLVDFGIACQYTPNKPGTLIGTPGYAAPEQYQGLSEPRSDLYSLGVMMHYLLTGVDPECQGAPTFQFKRLRDVNPSIPEEVDSLVYSLLSLAVKDRPKSAHSVISILRLYTLMEKNREDGEREEMERRQWRKYILEPIQQLKDYLGRALKSPTAFVLALLMVVFIATTTVRHVINRLSNPGRVSGHTLKNDNAPKKKLTEHEKKMMETKFIKAIAKSDLKTMQTLLNRGMTPNILLDGDKMTPLHYAALNDQPDPAMFLISRGAEVNRTDAHRRTPLYLAKSGLMASILIKGNL